MNRRQYINSMATLASALALRTPPLAAENIGPATYRTPALAEYERLRFGVSYHFSMNTFTGNDYETGSVPASTYDPTQLDVRQWIRVARGLGARYAVLTAKHMSGFSLWDSTNYNYDVAASGNQTDVVAAFVGACHEYGLRPGFYYCILDPHNEGKFDWNAPIGDNYYALIKQQLTELHSRYPNTFYQLLDITWKISLQQRWELYRLIKGYSPNCIIVMNQAYYQSKRNQGRICEPDSWPTDVINGEDCLPPPGGHDPHMVFEGKQYYIPFESWIPTGPPFNPLPPMRSWFWRPGFQMQPAEVVAQAYRECMDRNANLLLNLSPDTTGQLPEESVETLRLAAEIIRNRAGE